MLCGEFHRAPIGLHLNSVFLSANPSPYCSLLTLVRGMAAITAQAVHEDEDIFLENGLLSYENPNYRLGPSTRLDDALNSNTENIYEDIYQELDDICNMGHGGKGSIATNASRKAYAALDITSMGVDINKGPVTQNYMDNRSLFDKTVMTKEDENGIQHIVGSITNDLYAVPMRKCPKSLDQIDKLNSPDPEKEWDSQNELPPGWEKHEDNDGPYYWHIKSGTIQREIPIIENHKLEKSNSKLNLKESALISSFENNLSVTRSCTSSALNLESDDRKRKEEIALKRRSFPSKPDQDCKERPIRFAVRSLGWVEISEDDLTPERSSKAVNKCIVDLSLGRNDLLDVVGRWGDGKDLFMDLDEGSLKLFDPENLTVLNTQPIHTIRVWGVGRDNGRDFAYVARDRTTRKHMCHVFRCDMPARTIANTLRDICKKIMIERSLQQNLGKAIDVNGKSLATRPNNLPTEHRRPARNSQIFVSQSFPTPMEEPKKILRAQYLGCTQVAAATGMDVLNESIDRLMTTVPPEQWQPVNISIAPSMISIHHPNDERVLAECRVRYLSFLGIGKIIKHCAFIMHTAQDTFMSHVFYCEPSSGALCKTIEAACKLRYQKCLDAHPQGLGNPSTNVHTPGSSIGAALKSIVGSLRGRKSKSAES
ncbi:protein Fe65 homolog isoform X2 [Diorhabda carinulata]|uniref:protein Fe65 homolog isoform X3 n=1 Tax=Diorhabda sublineata TaxID=1163346 RepID=UPI0024E153F8|nr:protein Fe65 homolog isoform X3 [Diorhabda sublineata]XP_057669493.1 protein Fe65 homolog isoform X2 [Diorhabda carinulata]